MSVVQAIRRVRNTVCQRPHRLLPIAILGIHAGLLCYSVSRHAPTVDEPFHLAAGIRHWQDGRFDVDQGNPPLVGTVAAIPALLADPAIDWTHLSDDPLVGTDFMRVNGQHAFTVMALGQYGCVVFSLLGAWFSYLWASELYGRPCGLVAMLLWSFDPNILGNGHLITGDVPATAIGLAAFYFFWKWLKQPFADRAMLAGLALGLAELTKYVWVLLYLLGPLLCLAWHWAERDVAMRGKKARRLLHLALMAIVSVYVVNLGYAFISPFKPLDRFHVGRRLVDQSSIWETRLGLPKSWRISQRLPSLPVPYPEDYILGLDGISTVRDYREPTYLRGRLQAGGWWLFYPYAMMIKLPLGTLMLFVLSGVMLMQKRFRPGSPATETFLVLAVLGILAFVTCSGVGQRMRYVLPALPLLYVWASKVGQAFSAKGGLVAWAVAGCLVASVGSSLWSYPHSLAYFNEAIGGPHEGHHHLIDANLDWGQDLFYLKQWLHEHPEARPIQLAYFGRCDPSFAGIDYTLPSRGPGRPDDWRLSPDLFGPRPGWYAVSVNFLRGLFPWDAPTGYGDIEVAQITDYQYFRLFRPVASAGYSIYIYHLEEEDVCRVRGELGFPTIRSVRGEDVLRRAWIIDNQELPKNE